MACEKCLHIKRPFSTLSKVYPLYQLIPGYRIDKNEPISLMGPLYSDIKTKKKFRGRFLRSLVNLLDQDSHSNTSTTPAEPDFAQFIVENLLYLEYGVIEE